MVRAGGVGDTLLILPTLQRLRERLGNVELTLVGSHWAEKMHPLIPFPLEVVRFDSPALTTLFASVPAEDTSGVFSRADAVLLYTSDPEGSFAHNVALNCPGRVITWPVVPGGAHHAAVHFARALGDDPVGTAQLLEPELRVPDSSRYWAREWLEPRIGPSALVRTIHPGSGSPGKCWPAENWTELIGLLPAPILLLEGPADAGVCDRVRARLSVPGSTVQAAGLSLLESAALLEQSSLFVGNDSGISHLAAALGLPTVAVFGPTDPSVWAPLGSHVAVVRSRAPSSWPAPHEVLAAVERLPIRSRPQP